MLENPMNKLYFGNNLEISRKMNYGSVNHIYYSLGNF